MSRLVSPAEAELRDSAERRRVRAVRAATVVARSHGLDASHPTVLADANNTIVHLRPAPIVAKVATTWIRDGSAVLGHELALAVHVTRRAGPMPPPAVEVPVEVHRWDGLAMTFWRYIECSKEGPPASVTAGSLRRLHAALDGYSGSLPSYREELADLATQLEDPAATPTMPRGDRAFLRTTFRSLLSRLPRSESPVRVLHGDPHEGNRLSVDGAVLWVDLEAACLGPVEWDLSALDEEDAAHFDETDPKRLALMRDLRSCRVASLCWMQAGRAPAIDEAAAWHLNHLKEGVG